MWFAQTNVFANVGIVAALDEDTGELKTYIGIGSGYNQTKDEQIVIDTGKEISTLDITNFALSAHLLANILIEKAQD